LVEIRLLVLVSVDITHPEILEILRRQHQPSVAAVVSSEVVSNLESVPYIDVAIATQL
jgi:hypothetical protein